MIKTTGHISELSLTSSAYAKLENPIRPELFQGQSEARPGRESGLTQFGANYVVLEPGSASSLRHWHTAEDEFVYVLEGTPSLVDNQGEHLLSPGSYAGFPAGDGNGHHLINHSNSNAVLLVIGSRHKGEDVCHYPDDELGPIQR
jgi:uncharacterized cupin superfamily protein